MSNEYRSITYPIGVRSDVPKLGLMVPALVNDVLGSRFSNVSTTLALNSLDTYVNREKYVDPYLKSCEKLSINPDVVWVDKQHALELFEQLEGLVKDGYITEDIV